MFPLRQLESEKRKGNKLAIKNVGNWHINRNTLATCQVRKQESKETDCKNVSRTGNGWARKQFASTHGTGEAQNEASKWQESKQRRNH